MDKEFTFKNVEFRKRCVGVMIAASVIAGLYVILGLINLQYCQNYPRFVLRVLATLFYTVELCLFAERNSVYMEIGGDYALARRSCTGMLVTLIVSAIIESYYVSVFLTIPGNLRLLYMCIIIFIGCLSTLPLILFQYLNFEYNLMKAASVFGVLASLVSFCIGFLIISVNTIQSYGNGGFFETAGFIFDSFSPIYLVHCLVVVILIEVARITFVRQMKINAKFAPEAPEGEQEDKE